MSPCRNDGTRPRPALVSIPSEHALARLARPLPEQGLQGDESGTIVHVYEGGNAFEVEFRSESGQTKVVTLLRTDIR